MKSDVLEKISTEVLGNKKLTYEHVLPDGSGLMPLKNPPPLSPLFPLLPKNLLSHFEKDAKIARGARELPWQISVHMT